MPSAALGPSSLLPLAGSIAAAGLLIALHQWHQGRRGRMARSSGSSGHGEEEHEEEDVPEEFRCPISMGCMSDPVLLCGTGHIYCLSSLRRWLETGSRTCPKTNMTMRDVQVVRLPALRSRILEWRAAQGLSVLPSLDPPTDVVQQAGEGVGRLMSDLRSGDVYLRGLAAGRLNDLLVEWDPSTATPAQQQVMEAVLLDLVWLLRQGDSFGSGVAAAALSQYEGPGQVAFLAAVAAMPAVSLLWSPHSYGQHGAARLLAKLAKASPAMPDVLVEAGAVRGLLQQLDLRQPFPYSRSEAAMALCELCHCEAGQEEVRAGGGVALLKAVVLQKEDDAAPNDHGHATGSLRYEQRDAAGCLLGLGLTPEEAAQEPAVDLDSLLQLHYCSHAWVQGRAARPTEGYGPDELAAWADRLALGEVREAEREEEGEEEEEAEEEGEEEGEQEGAAQA